jgi:KUP system potassium uptake protein
MTRNLVDSQRNQWGLTLAALGVVYGDIGTSPLYAMRVALEGVVINQAHVLGVLSLIFWTLTLLISVKYLYILFSADNDGEGGILALLALIRPIQFQALGVTGLLAIFGAGLMLGDGMLTPAISILSAVEGLHVIIPSLSAWIIPLTCSILLALFAMQSWGTAKIGFIFGPIICLWFIIIATLGAVQIIQHPIVLLAINPLLALGFLTQMGWHDFALLGGVFLVVTGGEALYADLGHFGQEPIRRGWFGLVFPALLLNYFGQGAYLLSHPQAIENPFYYIAPTWFVWPLLIIATLATIVASQAVISALFSLTKQAILLGFYPHIPIIQTSPFKSGQIYIPQMNVLLAAGTLLLIALFQNSSAMTHAYGIAVNLVMLMSLILVTYVAKTRWLWGWWRIIILLAVLGSIDSAFLLSNLLKISTGGWVSIAVASLAAFVMYTWSSGRRYLQETYHLEKADLSNLLLQLDEDDLTPVPNATAIFVMDIYDKSSGSFLHYLKLSRMIPEHILLVNFYVDNIPYVASTQRFELRALRNKIYELTLHYGFLDIISIPQALYVANDRGLLPFVVDIDLAMYFIDIPNVLPSQNNSIFWIIGQEQLFAYLVKHYSANLNIQFYQLPFDRTVALGTYYLI